MLKKLPESGTPNTDADIVELCAKRTAERFEELAHENPIESPVNAAILALIASSYYQMATELALYRKQQNSGVIGAINKWVKFFRT